MASIQCDKPCEQKTNNQYHGTDHCHQKTTITTKCNETKSTCHDHKEQPSFIDRVKDMAHNIVGKKKNKNRRNDSCSDSSSDSDSDNETKSNCKNKCEEKTI